MGLAITLLFCFVTAQPDNSLLLLTKIQQASNAQVEKSVPIIGLIQDRSGKAIPNVKLTIVERLGGAVLSTAYSDELGNFSISPGSLTRAIDLLFDKAGYRQAELNGDQPYTGSLTVKLTSQAEYDCMIGDYYFFSRNYIAAAARYQEAIRQHPELEKANDGLARSLERTGEFEKAIKVYSDFIGKYPDSPAVSVFKSRIEEIQKKKR